MRRFAAAVIIALAVASCGSSESSSKPTLSLVDFADKGVSLDDLRGRPAIINIWQTTCKPCKDEMPEFQKASVEAGDRVRFIGIDSQDDTTKAKQFATDLGITYALWSDPTGLAMETFQVASLPTTIALNAEGAIVVRHIGVMDADELRTLVSKLTAETPTG